VSAAFDERLAKTRGNADEGAAAMAASQALRPELLASIDALRQFEEADPARTPPGAWS
jgi:hypothetical protein